MNYFGLIILSIRLAGETSGQERMVPARESQLDADGWTDKYVERFLDECIHATSYTYTQ